MSSRNSLRCANGSDLLVLGYSVLDVKIGSQTTQAKFTVAQQLSPNIILGMKFMKKMDVTLKPSSQCITVGIPGSNTRDVIPFISQSGKRSENA